MDTNRQVLTNTETGLRPDFTRSANGLPFVPVTLRENTVLVVDDNPDNRDLLKILFGNAGYNVLAANDGAEGFEVARRERPDLVISDVAMPGVNGVTLCRLIKSDAELWTTPVLLVSALLKDTATVVEGLRAGADDYLESPYEPPKVIAKAARLIEMSSAASALRESEERFHLMAESAPVMLWMTDQNKVCTYFNKDWVTE